MPRRSLNEQLDEAVEAIRANPQAPLPRANPRLSSLLRIAAALCELPREEFRARLKTGLERSGLMSSTAKSVREELPKEGTKTTVKPVREGFHTITPYLLVASAAQPIDFLKQAFAGDETGRAQSADGTIIHAKVRIGDSILEMGEAHGEFQPMPCMIHLYVNDADAIYNRAMQAGAAPLLDPADQPYGDHIGAVRDSFGNVWCIATHVRDVPV